jgi:hypothetical protein
MKLNRTMNQINLNDDFVCKLNFKLFRKLYWVLYIQLDDKLLNDQLHDQFAVSLSWNLPQKINEKNN